MHSPVYLALEGNYFKLTYNTESTHALMSGAEVIWGLQSDSEDDSTTITRVISILATVLIAIICCGCTALCVCKLWHHIKSVNVYDRVAPTPILQRGFSRIDQSAMLVSDGSIDSAMPRETFQRSLLEVGDAICTICLDEYELTRIRTGTDVRKLPCKHVFHALCIEEWIKSPQNAPNCPLCKSNPFQPVTSSGPSSPLEVSEGSSLPLHLV
jgi:hypothetical protein